MIPQRADTQEETMPPICPQCGSNRRNEFIEDFLEDSGCSPSNHHAWHDAKERT